MVFNDRVLLFEKGRIISYKKGTLFFRSDLNKKPQKICRLPNTKIESILSRFMLTERLLRLEPRFAYPRDDASFYLSYNGKLLQINQTNNSIQTVISYRNRMHNPLNICISMGLKGFCDGLYYGEYWGNTEKQEVSLFFVGKNDCRKVYTFPNNTITHVHGIYPDYKNGRMLVLTGDTDKESCIWVAKDNFTSMEKLCGGTQQYRSCCAYTLGENIYFATDTPLEQNYIYKFNEKTGNIVVYHEISGPCIYSVDFVREDGKKMYAFATSVKPDSRMVGGWKYRLSTKLGPGVKDCYSHLYITDLESEFFETKPFKKDCFPYQLFQFGNLRFPYQNVRGTLLVSPQSIKNYHGKTVRVKMEDLISE